MANRPDPACGRGRIRRRRIGRGRVDVRGVPGIIRDVGIPAVVVIDIRVVIGNVIVNVGIVCRGIGNVGIIDVPPVVRIDGRIDRTNIGKGLYPGRSETGLRLPVALRCRVDFWPVDGKSAIAHTFAGGVALPHCYRSQRSACHPGNFFGIGAARIIIYGDTVIADIVIDDGGIVYRIVDDRCIADNGRIVDDRYIPFLIDVVIIDVRTGHVLLRDKGPVVGRRIIATADGLVDTYAGFKGGPAIIVTASSPAYPGRSPFVAGDPHPAVSFYKKPAAVVESRPTPGVIGGPGPAVFGINPMAVAGIGFEIRADIWHPHIAVLRIIYPLAIGA